MVKESSERSATPTILLRNTEPLRILLLDTEDGASHLAGLSNLTIWKVPTILALDLAFWKIYKDQSVLEQFDAIAIDTISAISSTTRQALILDPAKEAPGDVWNKRGLYASETRGDYRSMNDMLARVMGHFRGLSIATIFVCHEEDRKDSSGYPKRGPSVSPGLLKDLTTWSDIICNYGFTAKPVQIGPKLIPAGTRRLRVLPDNKYIVKFRQSPQLDPMPPVILEPTQADLRRIMQHVTGKSPWVTLYGPPGIGKTSLVVGAIYKPRVLEREEAEVIEQENKIEETKEASA